MEGGVVCPSRREVTDTVSLGPPGSMADTTVDPDLGDGAPG